MSILLALVLAAPAAAAAPSVTIPLEDYEKLRQLRERPSLTVVELLRVEGTFARRDLALSMAGRASGTLPSADVLSGEGFRLYGCEGEALVARGESGAFAVTPLAPHFRVRCRIALDGSDRLAARATGTVLEVSSGVEDGELVASGDGEREFSVVRRIAGGREDLPPSVAGRYRVTLLPDETRFLYRLEVRNPNRSHRRFELALRQPEHVESVNAPLAWDVEGGRYRFDLPPGESAIELSGRLTGDSFAPPVEASLQYLVVESHPLVRPEVTTSAKRVGVGEVGLAAQYRGAQAFLLDGRGEVAWKAARLEALKTAGIAVGSLEQVFFLGADGKVRGQLELGLDNQGAPALAVPLVGEPTFASIAGEPAFLTRDDAGRLFLPLSQGSQQVVLQDQRTFGATLGFAAGRLPLPQLGVPASRATVQLRYPAEWIPIYEELAPASELHLLDLGDALLLALLLVLGERLLATMGLAARRRWLLAGSVTLAAAFSAPILALGLTLAAAPFLALAGAALVRRLSGWRLVLALAGIAGGALVLFLVVSTVVAVRDLREGRIGSAPVMKLGAYSEAPAPHAAPSGPAADRAGAGGYQGLPARIEIPAGARRTTFARELLATDGTRSVFILAASARLVAALGWATALLALAVTFAFRRDLAHGARGLAERLRPRPSRDGPAGAPAP